MVIFILLTRDINLSIQSPFLSKVSIASKVTPFLGLFLSGTVTINGTFMNGVEVCAVTCLSNFSLVSTLLAKLIASLRLFTLIKVA